jgi:hypothetical protein
MEMEMMNEKPELPPKKNHKNPVDGKDRSVLDAGVDEGTGLPFPKRVKVESSPPKLSLS